MHLQDQVVAKPEDFMKLYNEYPKDEPIVMINILKFKEKSGKDDESGRDAYLRYSNNVAPLLKEAEAKILWAGEVQQTVIGDTSDSPDMVLIVQYPTIQKFFDMATSEAYAPIGKDREIALQYGGLLASKTFSFS